MTVLEQTKNGFKLIGKVTRIDKDGAFREEETKKGKREGDTYRALRFGVKTSETNEITVEMFDYEPERVFLWNSELKKADKNYKGTWVEFTDWDENQDKYRDEGYAVLQTRVGLTHNAEGKIDSKGLPSFVASQEIYNNLDNGDSVVVEGEIRYSQYENQQGKTVDKKTYSIKKIFKLKDVDFQDEKFEEVTYFEQEIVFVDAVAEKENNKVFVTGRTIDYGKNFIDTEFVIDYSDGNGGTDKDMVKLATAFLKKTKFGDVLKVFGDALNRVVVEEVEDEDGDDEDLLAQLGGRGKPKHAQTYTNKTYVSEMQIFGVEAWDKAVYVEEDFDKDELIEDDSIGSEFGGKSKNNGVNPFESDSEEISEDDLPF